MRRAWLLSKLGTRLDYSSRDESRLLGLLALDDEELIQAIAGRRRKDLKERWERFGSDRLDVSSEPGGPDAKAFGARPAVETVCRHSDDYPRALRERKGAPGMLHVVGGVERLKQLTAGPTVAIVGSERPTDYGMEMARSLARGLAASEVTIVSGLANGIAAGAHAGAAEAQGPVVTVMAGGVDVVKPAGRRALYERASANGCAVGEPPCGYPQRRWCEPARIRTIAGLARLTIVVEADDSRRDLLTARVAQSLGRTVAAVPGRVTSPVSRGTNALLMDGAPLVRGPGDALDLLYGVGTHVRDTPDSSTPRDLRPTTPEQAQLQPRLLAMLEQVGAGRDTPGKLISAGEDAGETMLALSELELMGLLGRGDGGRYVPRQALPTRRLSAGSEAQ